MLETALNQTIFSVRSDAFLDDSDEGWRDSDGHTVDLSLPFQAEGDEVATIDLLALGPNAPLDFTFSDADGDEELSDGSLNRHGLATAITAVTDFALKELMKNSST